MGVIKGQYFRVKVNGKILAASKSCNIHKSADVQETTTKDSTGLARDNEVVATSWDGSANGLVKNDTENDALQGFDLTQYVGETVDIEYLQTTGTKNRSEKSGGVKYTGKAIINDCQLEFPDRADSTYSIQFTGCGDLTKGDNGEVAEEEQEQAS